MPSEIDDTFVDVYALVKLTEDDKRRVTAALVAPNEGKADLYWIKPRLVDWAGPDGTDGTDDDMLALYKAHRQRPGGLDYVFFVDRQTLDELAEGSAEGTGRDGEGAGASGGHPSVVLAAADAYMLMYHGGTMAEMERLLRAHGTGAVPAWDEGLSEILADELQGRAMVRGRIPAREFHSAWANLDLANMDAGEIVELHGGSLELIPDPEWDGPAVVRKAEEVYKAREAEELGAEDT